MLHEHLAEEVDAGKGIKESDSNEIVHVKKEDTREQVKRLIEEMNASCIGERISSDEFFGYYKRLPRGPPLIYLGDKLEDAAMDKQEECRESMAYDATWFKEYDDLYFEIWRRVTQKSCMTFGLNNVQISFEDALEEVCKLNSTRPARKTLHRVIEEKARKLIAEAVQMLVDKPKSYEQYIRKKIEIARIIGILPPDEDLEE
ncbi:hypothetical protein ACQ4PT_064547 [Festuca glaucescens]